MKKEELLELFDKAIEAKQRVKANTTALDEFVKNNSEPEAPAVVLDIDDYVEYIKTANAYKTALAALKGLVAQAEVNWNEVERELLGVIPYKIWFKHGDYAIGKAYTNWGGSRHYLQIIPWKDGDLPSLDHTYHGD